jgi:hypothetical protein
MYENAKYMINLAGGQSVIIMVDINSVQSWVPVDPANTDYATIMALVAAGELTIAPADGEE